ncbi:sensor histidine kinase [Nakamurella sp. PAMC28650]|uniref:sensor histidine kinase n=1 Tax=Nakamurella sp. PAMC28650 TaxID=2762325 RepID=UPI00164E58E3|nr:ATP-binding protein [Nakamurella sp. PAMC28650]QNK82887.1 hypothetical protein H7F38_09570 [Nakamurella sp. PAMC28650]
MPRASRWAFRLLFCGYAFGLACWLLLGLLPTLAQSVGTVHGWLLSMASGSGPLAVGAHRVLADDPMMPLVPPWQAALDYGFSALNVGLGLALFARLPDALEARLLATALLGTAATFNGPSHRAFHILGNPWPVALLHFTFHVASGVSYLWAVVLFPDGRLPRPLRAVPGPGWAWAAALTAAVALICWWSSFLTHPVFFVLFFGVIVSIVGGGAQLLRLADPAVDAPARAASRLLIAGLLPAAATSVVFLGGWLVSRVAPGELFGSVAAAAQNVFPAAFALVPIVLCAAMIRHRLWDLDRVLARILVYGVLGGVAGAAYLLVAMTAGTVARDRLWWSVLALALVVAAFEPLRTAAGGWANRVVYGQVTSPAQALQELATGMAVLTPAGGLEQVERVTVASTRAGTAALYLVDGDRLVAATGEAQIALPVAGASIDEPMLQRLLGADTWPVSYHGEVLGALTVTVRPGARLTAADRSFLGDIAAHAGLLLHNALLGISLSRRAQELAVSADQLRGARRRLVAAFDRERRSLERDLHDGAQQALVAGIIGLRTLAYAPDSAAELRQLEQVLETARTRLTEVATGPQPAELARLGLPGALRKAADVAAASGLRVTVEMPDPAAGGAPGAGPDLGAEPPIGVREAETAVYFCCVEALQNAAKYSHASRVDVVVARDEEQIRFAVSDDGRGFDPAALADRGGGIPGLLRRLTLVGGMMAVESAPGQGTRVSGSIPRQRVPEPTG